VSDLVFLGKFWPTPTTPPQITVELSVNPVEASGGRRFYFRAEVTDRNGMSQGLGGELEAESKQHADLQAMYKLVNLLAEMLATNAVRS